MGTREVWNMEHGTLWRSVVGMDDEEDDGVSISREKEKTRIREKVHHVCHARQ